MSSINNISLYIPHVFENISKEFVAETFEKLRIGKVLTVDFVQKMGKDAAYNAAYLHFEYWYDNTAARNFQERVLNPEKEARIIYDEPWYWIVLENKAKKHVSGDRKPRVALGLQDEDIDRLISQHHQREMTNKDFSELVNMSSQDMPPLTDADRMEELMELMEEEECDHLITIDGRYVEELEKEVHFGRANVQYVYVLENKNNLLQNQNQELEDKNQELMDELLSLRGIMGQLSQRF
jgi:hypothetical protein